MAIQIQLKPLGRGFNDPTVVWSVYEEFRGSKLPKRGQQMVREHQRERDYQVRVVRDDQEGFIRNIQGTSEQ